jgi:hypothetical protein
VEKDRTHDQELHHPSPLARKPKRIEPTIKHYTTPLHWPENSKGSNPRSSTTPPLPTGQKNQKDRTHDQALHHDCQKNHLKYGALNYINDVTHVHVRDKFNQIAMKYNRLQPFSGLSAISLRVFD